MAVSAARNRIRQKARMRGHMRSIKWELDQLEKRVNELSGEKRGEAERYLSEVREGLGKLNNAEASE